MIRRLLAGAVAGAAAWLAVSRLGVWMFSRGTSVPVPEELAVIHRIANLAAAGAFLVVWGALHLTRKAPR